MAERQSPCLRAAILAAALAQAAPLAAQEEAAAAPEAATPEAPGPFVLVTGPATLTAQYPDGTITGSQLCLGAGETALLASNRITFELVGKTCHDLAEAEQEALDAEQKIIDGQALVEAEAAHAAARASGIEADIDRTALALATARLRLRKWMPTRFYFDGPPPQRARPVVFRLSAASATVLARMPRGTLISRATVLCLSPGEQATISGSNGQSVTYAGPGCMRRNIQPTPGNVGGLTFG